MSHGIVHSKNQPLIDWAYEFAKEKHAGQKRKYTNADYVDDHCVEVAKTVQIYGGDTEMICAALLHDVIEDTDCTYSELAGVTDGFYSGIASLVLELTDVSKASDGNRAVRKRIDAQYLSGATGRAQTIKYADLISNTESIVKHDKKFAKVYLKEKSYLLYLMDKGSPELRRSAFLSLEKARHQLKEQPQPD